MRIIQVIKEGPDWTRFKNMPGFPTEVKNEIDSSFFICGFIAIKDENVVARIACFVNPHHEIAGNPYGSIGYFECIDDYQVFELLMKTTVEFYKEKGIFHLLGPMNGSTWNDYRFVSSQIERPFLLEMQHPGYYLDFFRNFGYEKLARYYSQKTDQLVHHWEQAKIRHSQFMEEGVSFHPFNIDDAHNEFLKLGEFCNQAFKDNFLFSPISNEDFADKMARSLTIINPRYTILAKQKGAVVGFIFCYQDIFDEDNKTLVVKTIARSPAQKYQGLGTVLSSLVMQKAIEDGFTHSIHALILDSNISKHLSNKFKASYFRTYDLLTYAM